MEKIYNYTKITNVSRVKLAVYPLYFTGNIDVFTAVHRKPRKKNRPAIITGTLGRSKIQIFLISISSKANLIPFGYRNHNGFFFC